MAKTRGGSQKARKTTATRAPRASKALRDGRHQAAGSHTTSSRSAVTGRLTTSGTRGVRGVGPAVAAPSRAEPAQPSKNSAPGTPAGHLERSAWDRPGTVSADRADRHSTAQPVAALRRYLEPGFYTATPDPAWIGEIAGGDATVRMDLVRHGVPAQAVAALAEALDMSRDELTRALGLPRSTIERKLRDGGHLGQAESERVLGVVRLIGLVRRIVEESGDPTGFDAPLWVARWLQTPVPALRGRLPMQFMDTAEGRAVVFQLVEQMQSGAYA